MSADPIRHYGIGLLAGVATHLAMPVPSLAIPVIAAITTARLLHLVSLETLPPVPTADRTQRTRVLLRCAIVAAVALGLHWTTPPESPLFHALYQLLTRPLTLATTGVSLAALWIIATLPHLVRQQRPALLPVMDATVRVGGLYAGLLWMLVIYDDGPILARIFTPNLDVIDGVIVSAVAFVLLAAIYRILRPAKVDRPR